MTAGTLAQTAEEYLAMRRSLGYKLDQQGKLLLEFVGYLHDIGADTITTEAAVAWATQPGGANPIWWQRRLSVARCFARHLKTLDPACQVPPPTCWRSATSNGRRTCTPRPRSRRWCTRPGCWRRRCRPPPTRH